MAELDPSPLPYKKVLFCTDLSENADFAFRFAVDAARRRPGCELHLLHVVPETEAQFWKTYVYEVEDVDNKAKRDLDERIKSAYIDTLPDGMALTVEYRVGKDYQAILDYAKEVKIDLIVLGRQGRGVFRKALFGNVTEQVARKADCAVLIVPLSYERRTEQERGRE